jgi:hypothetical protein
LPRFSGNLICILHLQTLSVLLVAYKIHIIWAFLPACLFTITRHITSFCSKVIGHSLNILESLNVNRTLNVISFKKDLSIFRLSDVLTSGFVFWHYYTFYKIMTTNQGQFRVPFSTKKATTKILFLLLLGVCKESVKKSDGTPYDLKDLMKLNAKNMKNTKGSLSWFTEPPNSVFASPDASHFYFCENCLIVQSIPAKHCKLCESCCSKFDHHCLFILRCVGLKNHRPFINFLLSTIVCVAIFLCTILAYFYEFNEEINLQNESKPFAERQTLIYCLFASTFHIWMVVLLLVNSFCLLMVIFLALYQFKFISLGFTSQFPPPNYFTKTNKRMASYVSAVLHRIQNLYTFFFESCESNQDLYFRQQSEYKQAVANGAPIPLPYPRNNFDNYNYVNNSNKSEANTGNIPIPSAGNGQNRKAGPSIQLGPNEKIMKINPDNGHFEIDLD